MKKGPSTNSSDDLMLKEIENLSSLMEAGKISASEATAKSNEIMRSHMVLAAKSKETLMQEAKREALSASLKKVFKDFLFNVRLVIVVITISLIARAIFFS